MVINMKKRIIAMMLVSSMLLALSPAFAAEADGEKRGLVVMENDSGNYLSWRLDESEDIHFGSAKTEVSFNVYRDNELIANVENSTNYTDKEGSSSSVYSVAPVLGDVEGSLSKTASAFSSGSNYFDILLDKPETTLSGYEYTVGDSSTGDVDGDGEYEIIVKWDCNPKDNSHSGATGNVLLDAYKLDGTKLWRIDLGKNIRSGAHYTQFLVYDFDGDGGAEISAKTAPGSMDGNGSYVSEASSIEEIQSVDNSVSYVNDSGFIIEGDEYFTVFDGADGSALDTIYYPFDRYPTNGWGSSSDNTNRLDRFLAGVAYLDGQTPSMIYIRGYYGRTTVAAMNLSDGKIEVTKTFDSSEVNELYGGQGNHSLNIADVDGDGFDEIITGSICFDEDLSVKWCSHRGHGDANHIGDYDPTNEGLEYFSVHESGGTATLADGTTRTNNYGMTVYNAETGEELFHEGASNDTGRGIMANVGMGGYYQFWSSSNGVYVSDGSSFEQKKDLSQKPSMNFRVFWDGDLYDELLDGTKVTDWSGSYMEEIFTATGCTSINGTKAVPALQADILGDWREEIIYPTTDNSSLRVFVSNIETEYKIKSLMHDKVYCAGVAAEQTGYNQPPHIGIYVDDEVIKGDISSVELKSLPSKSVYNVGEYINTDGLVLTVTYFDGTVTEVTSGYYISNYDSMSLGNQTAKINYKGYSFDFNVTVESGFEFSGNAVTKYTGSSEYAIVPAYADGVKITKIKSGALVDTSVTNVTVYENIEDIEDGAIAQDVTIVCYQFSAADDYAKANGNKVEYIIDKLTESYNVSFEESDYDTFSELYNADGKTSAEVGGIAYSVGYRNGDQTGRIALKTEESNRFMTLTAARFSDSNRHPQIKLNNIEEISSDSDFVLSMDIRLNEGYTYTHPQLTVSDTTIKSDASSQVTGAMVSFTKDDLSYDTWYNYNLISHDGVYYSLLKDISGNILSFENLGISSSEKIPAYISVYRNRESDSGKSDTASASIDNLNVYTTDSALTSISITVTDLNGKAVPGASVTVSGTEYTADYTGNIVTEVMPHGKYEISVSAEGYNSETKTIAATDFITEQTIALSPMTESIFLDREEIVLRQGEFEVINHINYPENSDQSVTWSSDNGQVATVDENGVVKAVAEGSCTVLAKRGDISSECAVTVVGSEYEQVMTSIKILGDSSMYIPKLSDAPLRPQRAEGYDQFGVKMEADIDVSCDEIKISEENNVVEGTVPEDFEGNIVINAVCGDITAQKTVSVKAPYVEIQAEDFLDFDSSWYHKQKNNNTSSEVSQVINDINYYAGIRGDASDGVTGFAIKASGADKYLEVGAGKWNTSNRNAYMILNNAPDLLSSGTLMMDIYFDSKSTQEMSISIGDESTYITSISRAAKGNLSQDTWYKYVLVFNGTSFDEYVIKDGEIVNYIEITPDTMPEKISKLSFTAPGADAYLGVDNIELVNGEAIVKTDVSLADEAVGVTVSGGYGSAVTDSEGNAQVISPAGEITFTASGISVSKSVKASGQTVSINSDFAEVSGLFEDNSSAMYINNTSGKTGAYTAIAVNYGENGELLSIKAYPISLFDKKSVYNFDTQTDELMLWNGLGAMTPACETAKNK